MGLLDPPRPSPAGPYRNESLNKLYQLLFRDDLALYQQPEPPTAYPWAVLLAGPAAPAALRALVADASQEGRARLLAAHRLALLAEPTGPPKLLGVVVEVALPGGLDVLAAFADGSARYFNQAGNLLVGEARTPESEKLREALFAASRRTIARIGRWAEPRLPPPTGNLVRLSFLQTNGLYFGQGPFATMRADPLGAPVIAAATQLLALLTKKGLAVAESQPAQPA